MIMRTYISKADEPIFFCNHPNLITKEPALKLGLAVATVVQCSKSIAVKSPLLLKIADSRFFSPI